MRRKVENKEFELILQVNKGGVQVYAGVVNTHLTTWFVRRTWSPYIYAQIYKWKDTAFCYIGMDLRLNGAVSERLR